MADLKIPLNIPDVEVVSQVTNDKGEIIISIKSPKQGTRCHKCGKHATASYGTAPKLRIRHLSILDTPVYLEISPVRYKCSECGSTTTEAYDWRKRDAKIRWIFGHSLTINASRILRAGLIR